MTLPCTLLLLTFGAVALPVRVEAARCSCSSGGPRSAFERSAATFLGRVVALSPERLVRRGPRHDPERTVRLVVTHALKGVRVGDTVAVTYEDPTRRGSSCGWVFEPGAGYLVYAMPERDPAGQERRPGGWYTSYCAGTRTVECAASDLQTLGATVPPEAGDCNAIVPAPPPSTPRRRAP